MRTRNILIAGIAATVAAIGIGIGGAQAANLIDSHDIEDDSVRSVDVKDGTLGVKDMRPGAVDQLKGQDGKDGEDGKDGKDGKDASVPAAGAGYAGWPVENPHHDMWAPHSAGTTIQKCHAGEYVTGGGFSQQGGEMDLGGTTSGVEILVSAPYVDSYEPISETDSRFHATKWIVKGYNGTDEPVDVRAWVLCTSAN
jgi:hypothetical protein